MGIYIVDRVTSATQHTEYVLGSGGLYEDRVLPGPGAYRSEIERRLFAKGVTVLPGSLANNPGDVVTKTTDPLFAYGISENIVLPPLRVLESRYLYKSPSKNKDFRKSVKTGDIIVNPCTRSLLTVQDVYIPLNPIGSMSVTFKVDDIGIVVPAGTYPGVHVPTISFEGKIFNLPYDNRLTVRYRYVSSASEVSSFFAANGITAHTVEGYRMLMDLHVTSQPFNAALFTKVVGDARAGIYDVLTDLGEVRDSVQTIMACVLRILRAYLDMKNHIAKRTILKPKDLASMWLEFRYAIQPMVLSINNNLKWQKERNFEYFKYRGRNDLVLEDLPLDSGTAVLFSGVAVSHRAFGKTRVSGATAGLKINPLATALELVPLSFLLNWVCNIGDVLSSLQPPQGAQQEKYTYSRQLALSSIKLIRNDVLLPATYGYYSIGERDPITDTALTWAPNLSWKRLIDAFAIAYSSIINRLYKFDVPPRYLR